MRTIHRMLDLFCGAGGAARGYQLSGFHVIGVDNKPQPRYAGNLFIRGNAMTIDLEGGDWNVIHASPPCQRYTALAGREDLSGYPDLVGQVRERLERWAANGLGRRWIIENVPGAPLQNPIVLCGAAFGLRVYRHRLFETNFPVAQPPHFSHTKRVNRRGENRVRHWMKGGFLTVTGNIGTYFAKEAMGIDWMTGAELSQSIPPAYTQWLGNVIVAQDSRLNCASSVGV